MTKEEALDTLQQLVRQIGLIQPDYDKITELTEQLINYINET